VLKTCKGVMVYSSTILNFALNGCSAQLCNRCIGGPNPVWMLWRREKSLTSARNQTLIPWLSSPLPSLFTNWTTLDISAQLLYDFVTYSASDHSVVLYYTKHHICSVPYIINLRQCIIHRSWNYLQLRKSVKMFP
jgi:hypothetical protein